MKSNFNSVKEQMLDKFNVRINNQKHLYISIGQSKDFQEMLSIIALNSRVCNSTGIVNEEFLKKISDDILIKNKFYINKENILEEKGISILINCKSKHKLHSESYHFGNCVSEHLDNCESYHLDNCTSEHWNKSKSVHFDNVFSKHHDNTDSQHYQESTYIHDANTTFFIDKK